LHGRGWAAFALAFLVVYTYGRSVLHTRAVAVLESRMYRGRTPAAAAALPDAANPWKWHGMVETGDFYAFEDVDLLLGDFDPTQATVLHKPEADPALDAAARTATFRRFLQWAQYPLWRVSPVSEPENGRFVELYDARFGPSIRAWALAAADGRVLETHFSYGMPRP
jgi:hypothetical protein